MGTIPAAEQAIGGSVPMSFRSLLTTAVAVVTCVSFASFAFAQAPTPAAPKMDSKMTTKSTKPAKSTTKSTHKSQPRDPKTGRYVKASPSPAATSGKKGGSMTGTSSKSTHKSQPRDPKTGRYVKASPSPAAPKKM
jgi:hypothetical protein